MKKLQPTQGRVPSIWGSAVLISGIFAPAKSLLLVKLQKESDTDYINNPRVYAKVNHNGII